MYDFLNVLRDKKLVLNVIIYSIRLDFFVYNGDDD
jgi:hypothetical protein